MPITSKTCMNECVGHLQSAFFNKIIQHSEFYIYFFLMSSEINEIVQKF